MVRFALVTDITVRYIGDRDRALAWLRRPQSLPSPAKPQSSRSKPTSARGLVIESLAAIAFGGIT
jgi:hypothetical protein